MVTPPDPGPDSSQGDARVAVSARTWVLRASVTVVVTATVAAMMHVRDPIPWASTALGEWRSFLGGVLTFFAMAAIGTGFLAILFLHRRRARGLFVLAVGLAWVLGFANAPRRGDALRRTIQKADRVVHAIERFERDEGLPPPSVTALIPRYLAESDLPRGGTTLRYASETSPIQPWVTWEYRLPDPQSAERSDWGPAMRVTYSGQWKVVRVELYSPTYPEPASTPFDSSRWARGDTASFRMARALRDSEVLLTRDSSEIVRLLGNPSERRAEHPGKWFLAVASAEDLFGDPTALILDSPRTPHSDWNDSTRFGRWSFCPNCYEPLPPP